MGKGDRTTSKVSAGLARNRFNRHEWAGAFGDLGTLIPFVVGYVSMVRMAPGGILLGFGAAMVLSGLYYRTPFPVQPMKVIGAVAAAQTQTAAITPNAVYGAGLVTGLIWLLLGMLEAMIALRFGLKLIGANPDSPIVGLIYGFTNLFLFPFTGVVNSPAAGNMELEISSLFAMLIYGLIGWAVERVVWLLFYRPRGPVVGTTQTTTSERSNTP